RGRGGDDPRPLGASCGGRGRVRRVGGVRGVSSGTGGAPLPLGVLLLSGGHERAHYALVLATGAAAIGRPTILFASNAGCRLLLRPPAAELLSDAREATLEARGVAGIGALLEAAREL